MRNIMLNFSDCNDQIKMPFPVPELCNNKDDDCDGQSDEDAVISNLLFGCGW